MQFQPQPHKQLPTQIRSMQRNARQLQQVASKPGSAMTWTDLTPQLTNSFTSVSGHTLRFEIEPGGNFAAIDGVIATPVSAPASGTIFATLGNATECIPLRNETFSCVGITSGNAVVPLGIMIDTSGNLTVYGALTSSLWLYISGRYPLNAAA